MRAHPRSRGENRVGRLALVVDEGSSPLTRGKPPAPPTGRASRGLIPAHAGKTAWGPRSGRCCTAHPRSRGENEPEHKEEEDMQGSSPLTRGKRLPECLSRHWPGLIPAHAGKTWSDLYWGACAGAHPRSRGENKPSGALANIAYGSSPLTRGKLQARRGGLDLSGLIPAHAGKTGRDADATPVGGLIPAHAGKTAPQPQPSSAQSAHPRSRGENATVWSASSGYMGSSPLTRGKRGQRQVVFDRRGLIPAHAGKTSRMMKSGSDKAAHPRSRGENSPSRGSVIAATGSSPLTRGKRYERKSMPYAGGLIPAHAGKTRHDYRTSAAREAHPRSRGENTFPPYRGAKLSGSSPLTRGKRQA